MEGAIDDVEAALAIEVLAIRSIGNQQPGNRLDVLPIGWCIVEIPSSKLGTHDLPALTPV